MIRRLGSFLSLWLIGGLLACGDPASPTDAAEGFRPQLGASSTWTTSTFTFDFPFFLPCLNEEVQWAGTAEVRNMPWGNRASPPG